MSMTNRQWLPHDVRSGFARLISILVAVLVLVIGTFPADAQEAASTPAAKGSAGSNSSSAKAKQTESRKAVNWRARRVQLNREYGMDLRELVNWCRENDLEEQVEQTFRIYHRFGMDRQYIFLPTEKTMPVPKVDRTGQWLKRLNEIKIAHASRLFDLAKEAATAKAYAVAFQLLHEVIYYNRDHAEVRRMLGHRKLDSGTWKIQPERIKVRNSRSAHDRLQQWQAGSYIIVNSTNFQIDSNASEEATIALAEKLEKWHYAWRQVFFEYWTTQPSIVQKWIDGKSSLKMPKRKFRVVFFKNHANYLKNLARIQKGIERSAGYYNGDLKISFFPATNAEGEIDESTWRHEMTHQLFRESIRTRNQPFAQHFLWVDEGVAMHFESLKVKGQIATLGGFDAQRLQFARIRRLRENYSIPLSTLAAMDMRSFQSRSDIGLLYAQCAGVAHMLMDSQKYDLQPALIRFLKLVHKKRVAPTAFSRTIGRSLADLDKDYLEFLQVSSEDVEQRIENANVISELAAADADLSDQAFDVLSTCHNLRWIDIAGSKLSSKRASQLKNLDLTRELFLRGSSIEIGALKQLSQMESLVELDLSSSSVNDAQIEELQSFPRLKVLWIENTRIGDNGLMAIAKFPKLKMVRVADSKITQAGIDRFRQLRNDVQVVTER